MTDVELELVEREYHLLHELQRRDIPSVEPVGTCRSRFPTVHFSLPVCVRNQRNACLMPWHHFSCHFT
jgi:hypothetical protein